jgi:predicted dehydrogenase
MPSRRNFLGTVASGLATTTLAPGTVLGANDRVRLGIIGPGDRGQQIMREALQVPNVQLVGAADVYTRRLDQVREIAPGIKTHLDYRNLLADKDVDAILIATPQHLHCEHFTASLEAGKHVYQEKTMAFTVAHAKKMRAARQRYANRVVQIGHQGNSSGAMTDALRLLREQPMGKITAIHMCMFRNTPHGRPQWSRPVYPDMTPENILWKSFQGEAPDRPFDPNRYINWRFFFDYSGGNVYENMCHQMAFWYQALDLKAPLAVNMMGGVYLWKDGREVPDTMTVTLEHPEEMLITWNSGFGNQRLGSGEDALGADGTLSRQANNGQMRWSAEKVNVKDRPDQAGDTRHAPNAHMVNFIDAIRMGAKVNCPFETGFRVSIACRMAVQSYLEKRTVRWDAAKEEIV